jgi:drug/metabolite transporter (DMT)-like permease
MSNGVAKPALAPSPAWLLPALAALLSSVFFGLNAIACKILFAPTAEAHFDPDSLFVARGFWSLPLFLALAVATIPRPFPRLTRKTLGLLALCGLAYGPGTIALSTIGASKTSAAHAVLLLSLLPPLASMLAALLLHERLPALRIVAIVIGVIGAVLLTSSRSGAGATLAGDLLIGGFILAWAILTTGIRKLDTSLPPLFVAGVFGVIGCFLLCIIGLAAGRSDAALIPLNHFDATTIIWFDLELVFLLALVGQILQSVALRSLNVAMGVALMSYGSIAAGLAASIVLLGERLTAGEVLAGGFLVIALGLSIVPTAEISRLVRILRGGVAG